ncbi:MULTISPECIES: hypothetical protein [unclassified Planococcus (in: firmicutes)]|uniref:hypothetical protein n=1 Tax=Planococcus TaxID=1372 RepID=UPI000C338020|nr:MULTISPECIES: hypothetical protein [unclassified Planococcus (in: firmicutes)]AUD14426.1 hypothetical protein CW734_13200 [Planococcus sp. MB-3u-03]PKG44701.1 hypothetical protein CXF66_15915 [Planococcus sp. Urea-trap-24]PKG87045.1 hypothetical protein CXF91_13585 [Planococcus sp. Urea-3u-39]PKH41099.1 hypothetical protein CXF77_06740 [Planococcus sp. MB-3u-09]
MAESKEPFIWLPVIEENQVTDIQAQGNGMNSKQFKMATATESGEHAPISRDKLEEMVRGFEGYEVETIELNVVGAVETGGLLQFIVAGKAEAGMTVTLKKKGSNGKSGE